MTRWLVSLVLVAGCGSDKTADPASGSGSAKSATPANPTAPDPAKFRALSPDEKCAAIAPRASPCIDEILLAQVRQLDGGADIAAEMEKDFPKDPSTPAQTRKIVDAFCLGDDGAAEAILTCWSEPDCKKLASCAIAAMKTHPEPAR